MSPELIGLEKHLEILISGSELQRERFTQKDRCQEKNPHRFGGSQGAVRAGQTVKVTSLCSILQGVNFRGC